VMAKEKMKWEKRVDGLVSENVDIVEGFLQKWGFGGIKHYKKGLVVYSRDFVKGLVFGEIDYLKSKREVMGIESNQVMEVLSFLEGYKEPSQEILIQGGEHPYKLYFHTKEGESEERGFSIHIAPLVDD